jgi:hypothetical protein
VARWNVTAIGWKYPLTRTVNDAHHEIVVVVVIVYNFGIIHSMVVLLLLFRFIFVGIMLYGGCSVRFICAAAALCSSNSAAGHDAAKKGTPVLSRTEWQSTEFSCSKLSSNPDNSSNAVSLFFNIVDSFRRYTIATATFIRSRSHNEQ